MWRGVVIVVYFAFGTLWLPNFVLHLGPVERSSRFVRDLTVLVVWAIPLFAGMYGLRWAQRRDLI